MILWSEDIFCDKIIWQNYICWARGWHFRSEKINVFFSSFIFTDHLTDNNQTVPDFFHIRPFSFLERWVNVRLATREFSKVWIQDLIFLKIYCLEFLSIVLSHEYKCFSYRFQFLECSRTALHGNKFYSTGLFGNTGSTLFNSIRAERGRGSNFYRLKPIILVLTRRLLNPVKTITSHFEAKF